MTPPPRRERASGRWRPRALVADHRERGAPGGVRVRAKMGQHLADGIGDGGRLAAGEKEADGAGIG